MQILPCVLALQHMSGCTKTAKNRCFFFFYGIFYFSVIILPLTSRSLLNKIFILFN